MNDTRQFLSETLKTLFFAGVLALIIRTVIFQPFTIPSTSMVPTLKVGDFVIVSKIAYGYSRHSVVFSPSFGSDCTAGAERDCRFLGRSPKRGEVAVFKACVDKNSPERPRVCASIPKENLRHVDYIKRVIGLPNDRIKVTGGVLYLNGEEVEREVLDTITYEEMETVRINGQVRQIPATITVKRIRETLPDGKSYITYDRGRADLDDTREFIVPPGHYFMMGDNRDVSSDSRVSDGLSYVSADRLVGRAKFVFLSFDGAKLLRPWTWFTTLRPGRLFNSAE